MMQSQEPKTFKCFCKQVIPYDNLKEHIKVCVQYHGESPFYKEFQKLPITSLKEVHLVAIHREFEVYLNILEEQLKRVGFKQEARNNIFDHQNKPQVANPYGGQDFQQNNYQNNQYVQPGSNIHQIIDLPKTDIKQDSLMISRIGIQNVNQILCQGCKRTFDSYDQEKYWTLWSCQHIFCKICITKQIKIDLPESGQTTCKLCKEMVSDDELSFILSPDMISKMKEQHIAKQFNLIKCVNCKEQMEFQPGQITGIKDANGNNLSKIAEKHYAENRFTCYNCKTEQCKNCQNTPYHSGYTCEDFQQFQNSKHCRYCNEQMPKPNLNLPEGLQDICTEEECMNKVQYACDKQLQCGHQCYGVKGEKKCQPCLNEECAKNNPDLGDQTGEDYCNICYVEGLNAAPAIRVKCGHFFHYHCLKKKLEVRWPSARVTFNFCLCPLCKNWMEFPPELPINRQQIQNLQQLEDIKKKSKERLEHEERLKDEKLVNPQSQYHNKPQDYAMAIYAYYECFKCKKLYFGGHKDCQQAMDDGNKEFDPKELVCANCCDIPVENCPKHGKDFIEFKCKFCCSIAQWFCWGSTHFCDPCHKRQCKGDYVSKYTKDKLPLCPGPEKCALKTEHKPNGDECSLGCSVCRNAKANARDF